MAGDAVSGHTGFNVNNEVAEPRGGWDKVKKNPERFGTACQVNVNGFDQVMNLVTSNKKA